MVTGTLDAANNAIHVIAIEEDRVHGASSVIPVNRVSRWKEANDMRAFIKTALLAVMLLASMSVAGAQVSIGVRIGPPPPPPGVYVLPARPGPEFVWVEGYWYPVGRHYRWHEGYWTRPPYEGARWVAPRHDGEQFFEGYWEGGRGRVEHDHRWDRDRYRDFRDHERHGDHDHDGR